MSNSIQEPVISVIVPCFNHGAYIDEAIESVLSQTYKRFEIIVVNDGSTDPATVSLLTSYRRPQTTVIHTTNQGLAAARNNGIREARGKYILPLDSDDLIASTFLEKAVDMLESNPNMGIVGCEVEWFGSLSGSLWLAPYSFPLILVECTFVCTSAFRRADWETVGGYKTNLRFGNEDWDFWLSLIELGRNACRLPEVLFYYRRTPGSMLQGMTVEQRIYARGQMFRNHKELYCNNIEAMYAKLEQVVWEMMKAQTQLSDFVAALQNGREVTFADREGPVAKLIPMRPLSTN